MPQLFFQEGIYKGTTVRFRNFIIIGTGESANLKLEDSSLAPVHMIIVKGNDGFYAVSLSENNPVSVNGNSIVYAKLNNGDFLALSENCQLNFTLDEAEAAEFPPTQPSKVLKKNKSNNTIVFRNSEKTASNGGTDEPRKVSLFSKILGIACWLIMMFLLLGTSFLAGIYTTDKILGN